ncbi:MAG: hypothetical protein EAX81_03680 [Candidatus Thorarchaeota archaeon]|nr:hypothetical protein [Candidatus Thorarchaeota archaeon]
MEDIILGAAGAVALFLAIAIVELPFEEEEKRRMSDGARGSSFPFAKTIQSFYQTNFRRWYASWLSLSVAGWALIEYYLLISIPRIVELEPSIAPTVPFVLLFFLAAPILLTWAKAREISSITKGRTQDELPKPPTPEFSTSALKSARLYMIAVVILCSFVMLLMVFMPALSLAYSLLIGILVPVIICVGGGYLLIISQNASEQSTSVSNNDVESD